MRTLVAFLLLGLRAGAQPVSIGVRGGVPLTDAFSSVTTGGSSFFVKSFSDSKEYMVGPMAELHLPLGLSVEADALFHAQNLAIETATPSGTFLTSETYHSWEFPILGKFHFLPLPLVKPFVEAGPSFRTSSPAISYLSSSGVTFGGGIEIKILRLRLEPELRYTHWGADNPAYVNNGAAPSNVNQAAFLVGIAF